MDEDGIIDRLSKFGLSEKASLAYITILRNGSTTIRIVSEEADISKSYAYDIVGRLEERDLIEIDDHIQPTRLRAIPPTEGIENLVSELYTVETELEELFDSGSYEQQKFSIIKSRRTILSHINDLIESAESEIVLSIPASVLHRVEASLEAAYDRDVFCMLLVTEYDGDMPISESIAKIVQTWSAPAPVTLTVDRSDGLVAAGEALLNSNSDEYAIYHAENHIVTALFDSFIANYWPMGEQQFVAPRDDLPRTYRSFRHAVFVSALYLNEGQTLEAELETRPIRSDRPFETTTGTIIDVKQSIVRPFSNDFPTQESLVLKTTDGTFTVGGSKAFLEDVEAKRVTLNNVSS